MHGKAPRPKAHKEQYIEENLILDKFSVTEPNYLWCLKITEIKVKGGKLYLCGVIDIATRRIIGWAMDDRMTQKVVQGAIRVAAGRNPEHPKRAIFHSERGASTQRREQRSWWRRWGLERVCRGQGLPVKTKQ